MKTYPNRAKFGLVLDDLVVPEVPHISEAVPADDAERD